MISRGGGRRHLSGLDVLDQDLGVARRPAHRPRHIVLLAAKGLPHNGLGFTTQYDRGFRVYVGAGCVGCRALVWCGQPSETCEERVLDGPASEEKGSRGKNSLDYIRGEGVMQSLHIALPAHTLRFTSQRASQTWPFYFLCINRIHC